MYIAHIFITLSHVYNITSENMAVGMVMLYVYQKSCCAGLQIQWRSAYLKISFFILLYQNTCGYSNEPSQWDVSVENT